MKLVVCVNFLLECVKGKEELCPLIIALVASIRSASSNNEWDGDLPSITRLFTRAYVRAMFAFVLESDAADLQYQSVLVRERKRRKTSN